MNTPQELNLAQALQRAFIEADEPSIASVATGSGLSRQRLSDWRSGRHVPARFEDIEPVVAYFRLVAAAQSGEPLAPEGDRVTGWADERWRQAWRRSTPTERPADGVEPVDRKPLAIAVMSLLVFLVAALAVMAFLLSWSYR